jgi:peroxiredoxin/predicted DsbA family dithiol-disulfide isomerase
MSQAATDHLTEALAPGTPAPSFTLSDAPGHSLSLDDLRGKPVILCFYPADWSSVCGEQVVLYNELLPEFQRFGAQMLGISVDGVWCHQAFAEARDLQFPLLADFEPKGAVARQYGVYRAANGISERALFVIDGEGVVRWSYVSPIGTNPGADGILKALAELNGTARVSALDDGAGARSRGPAGAAVTLVEYLDFECPDCLHAYQALKGIGDALRDVRHEVRQFPLRRVHKHAQHAAEASLAAAAQGKFWEMYDMLFEHQDALDNASLIRYAREIGLDEARFHYDLHEHTYADEVEQERLEGARRGVNGTPTFFINGTRYEGEVDAHRLRAALREAATNQHKAGLEPS